ncbi:ABC transporter C family member 10 [Hordeum vulgare]|nr:ABC transporter C family member 10 [Hordeum vulgare]
MSSWGSSQICLSSEIMEKLTRTNYVLWRTEITLQLRGAGIFGYVEGSMPETTKVLPVKDRMAQATLATAPSPSPPGAPPMRDRAALDGAPRRRRFLRGRGHALGIDVVVGNGVAAMRAGDTYQAQI